MDRIEAAITRSKLPPGYKVTAYRPTPGWWDCRVWKDGRLVLSTSMTMFEFKDAAMKCGAQRAFDLYNGKKEWS